MVATLPTPFTFLTAAGLTGAAAALPESLWGEFLVRGMFTLCTSRWKSGKTTLVSVLLARLATGGEVAGRAVPAGRAVVVSEEPAAIWADRHRRLDLGPAQLCCRPFRTRPAPDVWAALIDQIAATKPDLVVIDPLAMVLPGSVENLAGALLDVLEPLHRLTDAGAAVLVLHHPKKTGPTAALCPRGSGALTGFADILLELDRLPTAGSDDRRRRLRSTSRLFPPAHLTIELNAAGSDYTIPPAASDPDSVEAGWAVLAPLLAAMHLWVSRSRLLSEWLEDHDPPSRATLRRWLEWAEREGLVERRGSGRRHDPFVYALPGRTDLMPLLPPLEPLRAREMEGAVYLRKLDRMAAKMQRAIGDEDEEEEEDEDDEE